MQETGACSDRNGQEIKSYKFVHNILNIEKTLNRF